MIEKVCISYSVPVKWVFSEIPLSLIVAVLIVVVVAAVVAGGGLPYTMATESHFPLELPSG